MFSDCTDFIGHSKIYNNDLFIFLKIKKKKAHKQALQIALPQLLLYHIFLVLPYSLSNIFPPISIFIYQK